MHGPSDIGKNIAESIRGNNANHLDWHVGLGRVEDAWTKCLL